MHFFFLIVTFKAFFLFLIFSNFTIVCKGLIFFLYILNGISYDSWRCDLISFIHFIKFLDITFLNIIYFPSFSSLLLMILFLFKLYIIATSHGYWIVFLLLFLLPPSFPTSSPSSTSLFPSSSPLPFLPLFLCVSVWIVFNNLFHCSSTINSSIFQYVLKIHPWFLDFRVFIYSVLKISFDILNIYSSNQTKLSIHFPWHTNHTY